MEVCVVVWHILQKLSHVFGVPHKASGWVFDREKDSMLHTHWRHNSWVRWYKRLADATLEERKGLKLGKPSGLRSVRKKGGL